MTHLQREEEREREREWDRTPPKIEPGRKSGRNLSIGGGWGIDVRNREI